MVQEYSETDQMMFVISIQSSKSYGIFILQLNILFFNLSLRPFLRLVSIKDTSIDLDSVRDIYSLLLSQANLMYEWTLPT